MKPATWTVTSQTEGTQRLPDGTFAAGVVVNFRLSTGETGSVFMPHGMYTSENVKDSIQARAELLRRVGGLSGEVKP